ncbi:MAG: hypothetical protein HQ500_07045 [Flavobacteriales bacterium]|nr:hypothetical protein [Flavobacteriales bacterium]
MMEEMIQYLIPVFALAALAGGWMGVQIVAKKLGTKNHIDATTGCCGACANKDSCERNLT